jgi:guanylate kinase
VIEYTKLIVSLRTPGRGIVVEGPSGIGKTTSISKALDDLGVTGNILKLTARKSEDREFISILPEQK